MSQLATIFEKIKEDFFTNHVEKGNRENFELIFSPFSTGFTNDDFLFLDSSSASGSGDTVHKYYDELYDFFQIANTLPIEDNFWTISGDKSDYLSSKFNNIINGLRTMDIDTLTIDMLYEHPIFNKALEVIDNRQKEAYLTFYNLKYKLTKTIKDLKNNITSINKDIIDLEIKMNQENLDKLNSSWGADGFKNEIETKILDIVKDEFKRFRILKDNTWGNLDNNIHERTHTSSGAEFYLTTCSPNNLYKSNELDWKKITINQSELKTLLGKTNLKQYESVLGNSELSQLDLESIQFELIFVNVVRPWYEEKIIESPFWDINLLNKDEISIPKITSKLIFIRRVDIKAKQNTKNKALLNKKKTVKNLGPFMLNMANYKLGHALKLKSINTALKIDRKVVMNVSSKIKKKKKSNSVKAIVNHKQNQFIKYAPKLQLKHAIKHIAKPVLAKPIFHYKPVSVAVTNIGVNCRFTFKNARTNEIIELSPEKIKITLNKKVLKAPLKLISKSITTRLAGNTLYSLITEEDDVFESNEFSFKTEKVNSSKNNFLIEINEKEEEMDNAFQLIGVIAKTLDNFPNPIKKATYH